MIPLQRAATALMLCLTAWGCGSTGGKPAPADTPGAAGDGRPPDVLAYSLIPVAVPVDLTARTVVYRITSDGPLPDIPSDDRQTFERESETAGKVTVSWQGHPASGKDTIPIADPPVAESYRTANDWLESDDKLIKTLARQAMVADTNAQSVGVKCQAFVKRHITRTNLNIAFASARRTAVFREGDCTEHALLLAAIARALGIPSRVVGGMVYADQFVGRKQVFSYHMWAELWIDGAWRPFDAALHERGGYGVGHIALVFNDMSALRADAELNTGLNRAVGRLKVEVLEQRK
jgi:hypothetical protein